MVASWTPLTQGPFRRAEHVRVGVSRRVLPWAVAESDLVRPFRGVYLPAELTADPVARARAVALALPAGAVLGHRTAAWLHGIDARGPGEHLQPLPLECVVPVGTTPPRRPGLSARTATLCADDVTVVEGVPVTSARRTALDLARHLPPHMALGVLDAMAHAGVVDPADLLLACERWRGERGVAKARRMVTLCEPATESFGESWLRLRAVDAGFPRPRPQIAIRDEDGRAVYRLDLGWEEQRIGAEYDGEEFHSSTEDREHDVRRRDDLARRFGWTVVGVGRGDVLGKRLDLELGLGQLLGMAPTITRRAW